MMVRPNVRNVAHSPSDAHSTLATQQTLRVGYVMRTKSVGFGFNSTFHNKIFFHVDVDVKFAIFSYTENVKSHFFTQNMKFSNKTGNVARDLKKRPK